MKRIVAGLLLLLAFAAPSFAANPAAPIDVVRSGSAVSSVVLKTCTAPAVCDFFDAYATTGATAGFLMVFDAASAPSDGAVTPKACIAVPINSTVGIAVGQWPTVPYQTGVVLVFSTTGCFTKTANTTAFLSGRVQ